MTMNFWRLSQKKQNVKTLPFIYYYLPVVILAIAGFLVSIYLAVSHYRMHSDLGYSSFCAVSRALNCDTVSSSPYAVFWGIPVAIWGAVGYAAVLCIIFPAGNRVADKKRFWPLLFWIALLYSILSLILAVVSTIFIKSYCLMCILTYLVNFALLYYAWFINRRFGNQGLFKGLFTDLKLVGSFKKVTIPVTALIFLAMGGFGFVMPEYWDIEPTELSQTKALAEGTTEEGHPWIGAKEPELVIEEFTDYLCTQCRIKHFYLRHLIADHPDKIRLIHRHFPMDHKFNPIVQKPYHLGAGMLALFSIYAKEQGRFWEANDMFFQMNKSTGAIAIKDLAENLNLNTREMVYAPHAPHNLYQLQKDIEKGIELGITGTPGYVINGEVFQGFIPPDILKKFL